MKYDVMVIGGGLAGLTCAIRCAEAGLKSVVISAGESALAFASGAIDVLGFDQDSRPVEKPFAHIDQLPAEHPYRKLGTEALHQSLDFFRAQMAAAGLHMHSHKQLNHGRLTALGAIRPTWLSQKGTHALPLAAPAEGIRRVAVVNLAGFRDFQPTLLAAGLSRQPGFADVTFTLADIKAETLNINTRNPCELRAPELARTLRRDLFSQPNGLHILSSALQKAAHNADLLVIPSVLSEENDNDIITQLARLTGLNICEVATLPPSLPGMRIAAALKQRFRQAGGLFLEGDQVIDGQFEQDRLLSITTQLNPDMPLLASHFVLATGSFFSQGLASDHYHLSEPALGLTVSSTDNREQWSGERFLDGGQHRFSRAGVITDPGLNPYRHGEKIHNLYCAGAVLDGFNPVQEASAGGVAIGTGWFVAERIINAMARAPERHLQGQEVC